MSASITSTLILLGGAAAVLVLWYLSVLFVRRDTRRRSLPALARSAWIAAAVLLPLFGFALYLFTHILNSYLSPNPAAPPAAARPFEAQAGTQIAGNGHQTGLARVTGDTAPNVAAPTGAAPQGMAAPQAMAADVPARKNGVTHAGEVIHGSTVPGKAVRPAGVAPQPSAEAPRVRWELAVLQGPSQGQRFDLAALPARIGRGPDVQVALDGDLNVSRAHAELYEWNGTLFLRDLGSMFGTKVNGATVTEQALQPGDQITVGETILALRELP